MTQILPILMSRLIQVLIQPVQSVFTRAVAPLLHQPHQAGAHTVANQRLLLLALVDRMPLPGILLFLPRKP